MCVGGVVCVCGGGMNNTGLHIRLQVDSAGDTKIIDAEFGFYGPPAFDVALVLSGFVFSVLCSHGVDPAAATTARAAITAVYGSFDIGVSSLNIGGKSGFGPGLRSAS